MTKWAGLETRKVLLEAAWNRIIDPSRPQRQILDVPGVLEEAERVWAQQFSAFGPRTFSRGSITHTFKTPDKLRRDALEHGFNRLISDAAQVVGYFRSDVDSAAQHTDSGARRLAIHAAVAHFVEQDVLRLAGDRGAFQSYLTLVGTVDEEISTHASRLYAAYDKALVPIYARASSVAQLKAFDSEAYAGIVTALIEGAALRLALDQKAKTWLASLVAKTAADAFFAR
ncbi:hypothetical protein [Microbacterium azadirachtae]|uniref:hypothetical protein n=1 Tax=Microbacterium azadirachtae TaxID=582680 RepID=UPI000A70FDE3|nr:hypothetical protein [Microbacterium azadirachtae]